MSISLDAVFLYDDLPMETGIQAERADPRRESDAALVARAQSGDSRAFEELVRRYRNDVFALAHHFMRNREEAWDVSQEVFIKAFRGLKRFRAEASFKTWLLRITANHCKDRFKKRRLSTVAFDDAVRAQGAPAAALGPDRALEAQEIGQAIAAAVEALPAKHRAVFVLREYEGMAYDEIAQVVGCRIGTVMSRLHHARKKLRNSLIEMGIAEKRNHG